MASLDHQRGLAVRTAAVVGRDDAAVGGRVGVAAGTDRLAQRAGQRQEEAAGRARAGRVAGHGRVGAELTGGPAADGLAAPLART